MNRALLTLLTAASLLLCAQSAHAQELSTPTAEDDWQIIRLTDQNAVLATVPFNNGITLLARCYDSVFDVMLMGLPEARRGETSRQLTLLIDQETEEKPYVWTVGEDRTVAFSRVPAMIARELAKGGALQIIVPGERGAPRTRYVMDLGPSRSAIEETLTYCGRPLVDPRDHDATGDANGLPRGIVWTRPPRPTFPAAVLGRSPREGYVALSCAVTTEGRAADCQIESEQPPRFNLGRSVLRAVEDARLGLNDEARAAGQSLEGGTILFTVNFRMQ